MASASAGDPIFASAQPTTFASSNPSTTWTYTYDGDGLLKSRSDGAITTTYLWDTSVRVPRLIRTEVNAVTTRIVYGQSALYYGRADGSYRTLATDGLGSIRAEVDSSGSVTGTFLYSAHGQVTSASGSPSVLGYTGELLDVTGLTFLRARWYDGAAMSFTRTDPRLGDPNSPRSLNRTCYADGNPLRFTDPLGLEPRASGTPCQQPDALTVGVGLVSSIGLVAAGVVVAAGGVALAAGGIAEAGATGGAGVLVTVVALHEGAELAATGSLAIAAVFLCSTRALSRHSNAVCGDAS